MATFLELQTNVGNWLGNRPDIGTVLIKSTINQKYIDLAKPFRFRELEATEELETVASTATITPITNDWFDVFSVRDLTNDRKLDKKDVEFYDELDEIEGHPEIYVPYSGIILLHPVPDDVYTLRLRLKFLPTVLVSDSDEPVYPLDWHKAIEYGAAHELALMFNMRERAIDLKNLELALISSRQEDETIDRRNIYGQIAVKRTRG